MDKVRVDKWLWSVRIFKSRTLASNACKKGHVRVDGQILKPSSFVKRGDLLEVRKNNFNMRFKVVELIEKRVSAKLAEPCYEDHTPEEELNKFKAWFMNGRAAEFREKGAGRPTKRDRRQIDGFKEGDSMLEQLDWEEEED